MKTKYLIIPALTIALTGCINLEQYRDICISGHLKHIERLENDSYLNLECNIKNQNIMRIMPFQP